MLAPILSLRAVGPATILSHKCDILSLSKDDQTARDNRLPVHCCYLASRRHRIAILVATQMLGSVFGRTDFFFSRIFIFGLPDFLADFVAGFFLLIFVGKSARAQKNPPGKSPPKSSKSYTTKNPRHISAEGPGATQMSLRPVYLPPVERCPN